MRHAHGRWCIAHARERHQIYLRSQQRRLFAITYKRRDAHWRWSSLSTRGAMTFPFVYAIRRMNDKSPWILTRSRFASAGSRQYAHGVRKILYYESCPRECGYTRIKESKIIVNCFNGDLWIKSLCYWNEISGLLKDHFLFNYKLCCDIILIWGLFTELFNKVPHYNKFLSR